MAVLDLPAKMDFTMGSTEQKMDMTLDEIIKQTRKSVPKRQRIPIKSRNRNTNSPAQKSTIVAGARALALQRSVAARSSKLRQAKFADVRSRNGAGNFAATQSAGKRAFATPINTKNRAWMRAGDVRRNNFITQRPGSGPNVNPFTAAAGNMKISVINNGSKFGVPRSSSIPFRRRNASSFPGRQGPTGQNAERMGVDYGQSPSQKQKAKTLDALFAEIKERRNSQPYSIPTLTSMDKGVKRVGHGGFWGWRKQVNQ